MNTMRPQMGRPGWALSLLLLVLLGGLGGALCPRAFAQDERPVVQVRFEWVDPEGEFDGLDGRQEEIGRAVAGQVAAQAAAVYPLLVWTTASPAGTVAAEWIVQLNAKSWSLTPAVGTRRWWRVRVDQYVRHGGELTPLTREESGADVLYDFDAFPAFDDADRLRSELSAQVRRRLPDLLNSSDAAEFWLRVAGADRSPRGSAVSTGSLWQLLEAGESWKVVDLAMSLLPGSSGQGGDDAVEVLTVLTVALARTSPDPADFEPSGMRDWLADLRGDAEIGQGIGEILALYDVSARIQAQLAGGVEPTAGAAEIQASQQALASERFEWWGAAGGRFGPDPALATTPADGFRELLRSFGPALKRAARALPEADPRFDALNRSAEAYYRLAADLRTADTDPSAVRELVRLAVEADDLTGVEEVRSEYHERIGTTASVTPSAIQLAAAFNYHRTLGGLYSRLSEWGDVTQAPRAVDQLQLARQISYRIEDLLAGRIHAAWQFDQAMSLMLERACARVGGCGPPDPQPPASEERQDYIGDAVRVGIGYDSETELTGEFFWNFREDYDSAYSFEGWKGADRSGGLKVNLHWLADGVAAGQREDGSPIYRDGRVRKLFIAADKNMFGDGKLTFGGGGERRDRFWSLYASAALTGERYLGGDLLTESTVTSGETDDYHPWTQTDTWTTTTEFLAHPYDWGVGVRIGRHFDGALLRVRGGLDYEFGDFGSAQATAYAGLEKRFEGTGFGLSLRAEILRKRGDFETDRDDARIGVFLSWDFGTTFRSSGVVPQQCVDETLEFSLAEAADNEAAWIRRALRNPAAHKRSVDYYRYERVTRELTTDYAVFNQGPDAADDRYTVLQDSSDNRLPVLDNDSDPEQDRLNIVLMTEPEHGTVTNNGGSLTYTPDPGYVGSDHFRYEIEDVALATPHPPGEVAAATVFIDVIPDNVPPVAVDDAYDVRKNTRENPFAVMNNDYDPDGDPIRILAGSVTSPTGQGGIAVVTGATVSYTPKAGYCGVDRFTYAVQDARGAPSNEATVTVTVTNQPPVAVDDYATTYIDTPKVIRVLANDHDPDGDPIEITDIVPSARPRGTVVDNGDGTVTYTPYPGYWLEDTFQYTIVDDCGATATATVTVDIRPDKPPVVSPPPGAR